MDDSRHTVLTPAHSVDGPHVRYCPCDGYLFKFLLVFYPILDENGTRPLRFVTVDDLCGRSFF